MVRLFTAIQLLLSSAFMVDAIPMPQAATVSAAATEVTAAASGYWLSSIERQGTVAFGSSSSYTIYRNVKDFGAVGKSSFLHRPHSLLTSSR